MYYKGQGVISDYDKALNWYKKSADSGNAEAQYSLGLLYFMGQRVTRRGYRKISVNLKS